MKNYVLIVAFALSFVDAVSAQENIFFKSDSLRAKHEQSVYHIIQRGWISNQDLSYASLLPYVVSSGKNRIPKREGENKHNDFYLLEANLDFRYPLSKEEFNEKPLKKRVRWTFDYIGNFRMTLDKSFPLTPSSHRFGFGVNVNLHNNHTGWIFCDTNEDGKESSIISKPKKSEITFTNLLFNIHHYSNGQPPGFYYVKENTTPEQKRNDYLSGDFSTNYIYVELTKGLFNRRLVSLHQFSLGARFDLGTDNSAFAFSKEQENSYGRTRAAIKYDYRTERSHKDYEHHVRLFTNYIFGDMSNFQPNIEGGYKKYRLGFKAIYELAPKTHKSIGYFASLYYGRDYLNIRYDDIIFSVQVGFTLSMDKYFTPERLKLEKKNVAKIRHCKDF